MILECACGRYVRVPDVPSFGTDPTVECKCGAEYDGELGAGFGQRLEVCPGYGLRPALRVIEGGGQPEPATSNPSTLAGG